MHQPVTLRPMEVMHPKEALIHASPVFQTACKPYTCPSIRQKRVCPAGHTVLVCMNNFSMEGHF